MFQAKSCLRNLVHHEENGDGFILMEKILVDPCLGVLLSYGISYFASMSGYISPESVHSAEIKGP
jgi:hypothetical protein